MRESQNKIHFGGSFNPVHIAHLRCVAAAAVAGGFAEVVLVPNNLPPLKSPAYPQASARDRLNMLAIATAEFASPVRFAVDSIELDRQGTSYTFDTATLLRAQSGQRVHWLIGADQVLALPRWHRFEDLLQIVQFWVMQRPGFAIDWDALHPRVQPLKDFVLPVPQLDISATQIRRRVAEGVSIDGMVTPGVRDYIQAAGLYIPIE